MYRLTIIPALEVNNQAKFIKEFSTEDQMIESCDTCADLLLFIQDDLNVMEDYSNIFIREVLVDGEWEKLSDEYKL